MVLDSSACLDIVLGTEQGRALHGVLLDDEPALLAPGLLWVETARVLRGKVMSREVSRRRAEAALADFLDLGVKETQVEALLPRAWQLRENVTIDDGLFLALAEAAGLPLLTTDLRLAKAAGRHTEVSVTTHLQT